MSAQALSSRAIMGMYYKKLSQDVGASWVGKITNLFNSDQESETYKWLGQVPAMREWIGGRNAKGFTSNGITIENKHYESTLEVEVRELRRDKTGQLRVRITEHARRALSHWATLLNTLIENGESTVCYDGQFFFDTDHSEGDSGSQSNDISVDISELPVTVAGTTTLPSVEEMQLAIDEGIMQITSFLDDQGEPMNEDARSFVVMVPKSFQRVARQAVYSSGQVAASQTVMDAMKADFNIEVVTNPRLSWTTKFAVFRVDSEVKPLIRQQETDVKIKAKAEGSEYEFDNDAHQYGMDAWRNVGYGYWQNACLVTLI